MQKAFTLTGVWWLPSKPDYQIAGTLTFEPDGHTTLELIGTFKKITDYKADHPEIILGVTTEGKPVTLYRCFEHSTKLNNVFTRTSYYAVFLFTGVHFASAEDVRFHHMYFSLAGFDEWFNLPAVTRKSGISVWSVRYKKPKPITLFQGDKYVIDIASSVKSQQKGGLASIEHKYSIKVTIFEDTSIDNYLAIIADIQNFLSLCARDVVYPVEVNGRSVSASYKMKRMLRYSSIGVFYQLPIEPNRKKEIKKHDMMFHFTDIQDRAGALLQNWFTKAEALRPMHGLYFATVYNNRLYTENAFLSLAQAIEFYHRVTMVNYELPKSEHKKRLRSILDTAPVEYKDWLKEKLAYSNIPTLRKRLTDIATAYGEVISEVLTDEFIAKVANTRNYLTHYSDEKKKNVVSGEDLSRLTQQLKIVLEVCLFKEMGFRYDEIRVLIMKNRRARWYLGL